MSNYEYKTKGKHILVLDGEDGEEMFKIDTRPYTMRLCDLDIDAEEVNKKKYPASEKMTFYDGYAINTSKDCLMLYKTIEEVKALKHPDWDGADEYGDGLINFFQIQYRYYRKIIYGEKKVTKYLKEKNITL